ncbi:MAG: hypothetical protein KKC21_07225 [Nitrospinae bacterium]|nr:hypothetical protein [Nitrospinota bacterium]
MSKILRLLTIIAVVSLFAGIGNADAAVIHNVGGGFGDTLTVAVDTFGAGLPATAGTFTPSAGVKVAFHTDASGAYFHVETQHNKGTIQYGLHSNGGSLYGIAVTTVGTWMTTLDTTAATAVPATDFTAYTAQ